MTRRLVAPGALLVCLLPAAAAQTAVRPTPPPPPAVKRATAVRIAAGAIHLDGRLDDAAWREARFFADFIQKEPNEGAAPTERTEVAILYDDDALYVGARMFSRDPAHIQAPLARRDNTSQAEHVWVSFDSYHDRRTAYSFGVTASGVRMDWYHPSDNETDIDTRFDPVWEGKAVIDSLGWTAEMRIPFSQLRFTAQDEQVWGLNVDRWIPSRTEDVFWIPVPKNETGWSSRMGELVGISGIRPTRRVELVPYSAGNATLTGNRDPANPFDDGRNLAARAGADLKMGLGPNLTLDATVNPDFGQVEADPAVVNLSAFEVFFDERRPFFTEGSQLLRGNGPSYFYSRRIGAPARGDAPGDYVDFPQNTTILGAAKLTGRLRSGFSLGALGAVTGRATAQSATYDTMSASWVRSSAEVAPPSGYGVARVQQEFGASRSVIGATLTAVHRDLAPGSPLAGIYRRDAVAGGADWILRWGRGAYDVRGWLGFSRIAGDAAVINATQRSAVHYFQRPDARYADYDSTQTTLFGTVGTVQFDKNSGTHWLYNLGAGWESPGYDPNDAGRLGNADGRFGFHNLEYRETRPGRVFQSYVIGINGSGEWDFGGDRQYGYTELAADLTFRNFWTLSLIGDLNYRSFDHAATRGGPTMTYPGSWNVIARLGNNFGAKTTWNGRIYYGGDGLGGETYRLSGGLSMRPSTRWQLSITPNYLRALYDRQYVASLDSGPAAAYGGRYVFSSIDQSTFILQLRLNYTLTPDLSFELYAEPFAASGRYYGFGHLAAARTMDLVMYSSDTTVTPSIGRDSSGDYVVHDVNGYRRTIPNPDFNVLSFRSNAVLRWEWRPGSTLFLVWQQNRSAFDTRGALVGPGDLWDSLRATGDNFLAVKVSYWIPVH